MKTTQKCLGYFIAFAVLSACTKKEETVAPATQEAPAALAELTNDNSSPGIQEVTFSTAIIDGATAWTPSSVEVKAGSVVRIVLKHELKEGFDFHGFSIPELGITEQVNRNQSKVLEVSIPADKAGHDIGIACQFHPKHVGAKLIVR